MPKVNLRDSQERETTGVLGRGHICAYEKVVAPVGELRPRWQEGIGRLAALEAMVPPTVEHSTALVAQWERFSELAASDRRV